MKSSLFYFILISLSIISESWGQRTCGSCPQGTSCDSNTGICRQFRPPAGQSAINVCDTVRCASGTQCDPNTGRCVTFRDPSRQPSTNLCGTVSCPQGTSCDSNTGICRQFRPPAGQPAISLCDAVSCPSGRQCDPNTGRCVVFRDPTPSHSRCSYIQCPAGYQCDWNYGICRSFQDPSVKSCESVYCPQGTTCDSNTGVCRQFRPPAVFKRGASNSMANYCKSARCPNNFVCDPSDGICKIQKRQIIENDAEIFRAQPIPSHPPSPSIAWQRPASDFCPPNSEYNECGSRCPYTCTELHPRCTSNQHNCIGTCQCKDGFVQTSSTNVTCVPARDCSEISESVCAGLKCPKDMICVDGYCNPVNCPPILKPHLDRGCQYELVRDTRNCVVLKSSCD